MANILILGVKVPFVRGGQEVLVATLARELKKRGHEADIVELPLSLLPKEKLLGQAGLWRSLDLQEAGGKKVDLVIATKFPTYYARHPRKSIWLVHQHRAIYDLYGGRYSDFSDDPRDEALRRMLVEGDCRTIGEASFVSGISQNVVKRLKHFNRIDGQVLYPPLPLAGRYRNEKQEPYILSVGRLCSIKRVDLMIKAMPHVKPHIKLKIAGSADEPGVMKYFQSEIDKHHLWERVEFLGRVDDEALLALYANSLCVYYAPYNEDYGYVTLEAFASGKPVLTAHDSGGVLEFVKDGENGLIVDPDPQAMGQALNRLSDDPDLAARLGAAGHSFIRESGLIESGWDKVVDGLLSPLGEDAQAK